MSSTPISPVVEPSRISIWTLRKPVLAGVTVAVVYSAQESVKVTELLLIGVTPHPDTEIHIKQSAAADVFLTWKWICMPVAAVQGTKKDSKPEMVVEEGL